MRELVDSVEGDDPGFVEALRRELDERLVPRPVELFVVRLDNWFGRRWFHFAGKMLGAVGVRRPHDRVLPPFHPHRVVRGQHFVLRGGGYVALEAPMLHRPQRSEENFKRRLPGTCLWYSGATLCNGRGAAMVYRSESRGESDWYSAFVRRGDVWRCS